jgi:eukaryotic-like serine/threonine-protein kinase
VLAPYEPTLNGLPGQERHPEPAELPAEAARLRLYGDLAETFWALAKEQPLLLLLDDLQWADELTLGFLGFLARSASSGARHSAPLLLVGAYRSEEVGDALRALLETAGVRQLRLGRLEEPAVGRMLCDMLALDRSPEVFSRYMSRQSEGNPFFVAEYLRAAVHEGLLWRDESGRWQVAEATEQKATEQAYERLPLPQSLRDLVARHLEGLEPAAQRVTEAAAVLGREVDAAALAATAGLGAMEVLEGTLELLRRQVMEEGRRGSLRFVHDKIREVAYGRISELRCRELHAAAGEAIEAIYAKEREEHLAELGHHWERAGEADKARACYLAAARYASRRSVLGQAEPLYLAYLRLVHNPTSEALAVRLELTGRVLQIRGRWAETLQQLEVALQEARALSDEVFEGRVLDGLGVVYGLLGQEEKSLALLEQALSIARKVGDRRAEGMALDHLAGKYLYRGALEQGRMLGEKALAIHREIGDRAMEGIALGNLALCVHALGRIEEACSLLNQALSISREAGDAYSEGRMLMGLASIHYTQGELERAGALLEQALAVLRETGDRSFEAKALDEYAQVRQAQGHPDEARVLFERSLAIFRELGAPGADGTCLSNLALLHLEQGRVDEALLMSELALARHREIGHRQAEAFTLWLIAMMRRRCQADLDEAQSLVQAAETSLRAAGHRLTQVRCFCERGHLALARAHSARELLEEAEPIANAIGLAPQSEVGRAVLGLRRAQAAFEAGEHERLFRGELVEDLPEGLRRWLVQTGQLTPERALLPGGGEPGAGPLGESPAPGPS